MMNTRVFVQSISPIRSVLDEYVKETNLTQNKAFKVDHFYEYLISKVMFKDSPNQLNVLFTKDIFLDMVVSQMTIKMINAPGTRYLPSLVNQTLFVPKSCNDEVVHLKVIGDILIARFIL